MSCPLIVRFERTDDTDSTNIRPCHQVIGRLSEATNDRMFHDLVRYVQVISILDERPARFATTCVAAKSDIRLQVRNNTIFTIQSLLSYGLEEKVKCFDEALLRSASRRRQEPSPVAKYSIVNMVV